MFIIMYEGESLLALGYRKNKKKPIQIKKGKTQDNFAYTVVNIVRLAKLKYSIERPESIEWFPTSRMQ